LRCFWQARPYAFSEKWSAQVGYRYMDMSKEIAGLDVSVDLGGPIIVITYRF
jgi:opacity protein-like surface antigen